MSGLIARLQRFRLSVRARRVVSAVVVVAIVAAQIPWIALTAHTTAFAPMDYDVFGWRGAHLLTGQWAGLFRNPIVQAGPFELAFWGMPYLLGVSGVAGWSAIYLVMSLLLSAAIFVTIRRLARPYSVDATPIALLAVFFLSASGLIMTSVSDGHPAEVVVPLMWLAAAGLARRGHPFWAAVVLAATAGWEVWGLLAAPLLLLAPRRLGRAVLLGAAGGISTVALLFGPFVLLGPFRMFEYRWVVRSGTIPSLWFEAGHHAFPWQMRLLQGALALTCAAAVALLLRRSPDAVWLVPLTACAVRLLFDSVLADYYFQPPILLIVTGLAVAVARRSLARSAVFLVLLNTTTNPFPFAALGAAVMLLAVVAVIVALVVRQRRTVSVPLRPGAEVFA